MKLRTSLLLVLIAALLFGCTQGVRARKFGGNWTKKLAPGQKVVTVTWKDANLWILTRPAQTNETPITFTFQEDASVGIFNGTVTIVEQ